MQKLGEVKVVARMTSFVNWGCSTEDGGVGASFTLKVVCCCYCYSCRRVDCCVCAEHDLHYSYRLPEEEEKNCPTRKPN